MSLKHRALPDMAGWLRLLAFGCLVSLPLTACSSSTAQVVSRDLADGLAPLSPLAAEADTGPVALVTALDELAPDGRSVAYAADVDISQMVGRADPALAPADRIRTVLAGAGLRARDVGNVIFIERIRPGEAASVAVSTPAGPEVMPQSAEVISRIDGGRISAGARLGGTMMNAPVQSPGDSPIGVRADPEPEVAVAASAPDVPAPPAEKAVAEVPGVSPSSVADLASAEPMSTFPAVSPSDEAAVAPASVPETSSVPAAVAGEPAAAPASRRNWARRSGSTAPVMEPAAEKEEVVLARASAAEVDLPSPSPSTPPPLPAAAESPAPVGVDKADAASEVGVSSLSVPVSAPVDTLAPAAGNAPAALSAPPPPASTSVAVPAPTPTPAPIAEVRGQEATAPDPALPAAVSAGIGSVQAQTELTASMGVDVHPSSQPSAAGGVWSAERGTTLRAALKDWCERAGVQLIWRTEYDYPLAASVSISGDFEGAVRTLLSGFVGAAPQPYGRLHRQARTGANVLIIASRGNDYGE